MSTPRIVVTSPRATCKGPQRFLQAVVIHPFTSPLHHPTHRSTSKSRLTTNWGCFYPPTLQVHNTNTSTHPLRTITSHPSTSHPPTPHQYYSQACFSMKTNCIPPKTPKPKFQNLKTKFNKILTIAAHRCSSTTKSALLQRYPSLHHLHLSTRRSWRFHIGVCCAS